jgi:hypothetical protein
MAYATGGGVIDTATSLQPSDEAGLTPILLSAMMALD